VQARRAVPEFENAGGAAEFDLGVAGAHPRRGSSATCCPDTWRRTRWYPERSPEGYSPEAEQCNPVLRYRRQPALSHFFRNHGSGASSHATCCRLQIEWGALRSRNATIRTPFAAVRQGRAPRVRCWMSRPTTSSSRCCCANLREKLTVEEEEQGLSLEFQPTSKFHDRPVRQPDRIRAVETETVQQHAPGR